MKVRNLKHRRVVTGWWAYRAKPAEGRRLVLAPLSYWFSPKVVQTVNFRSS